MLNPESGLLAADSLPELAGLAPTRVVGQDTAPWLNKGLELIAASVRSRGRGALGGRGRRRGRLRALRRSP